MVGKGCSALVLPLSLGVAGDAGRIVSMAGAGATVGAGAARAICFVAAGTILAAATADGACGFAFVDGLWGPLAAIAA